VVRAKNREYRATLSDGKHLRIVALSVQRAYARAVKWATSKGVSVVSLVEIED
jgi:hypothetical protein